MFPWKTNEYRIFGHQSEFVRLAEETFPLVCRTDFMKPGFALIDLGAEFGSRAMRLGMSEVCARFDSLFQASQGRRLVTRSMTRFDQQTTTKPHVDGSELESVLVLGYEPTQVRSRIFMSDFSVCAGTQGLYPAEFLEKFNPMYAHGTKMLEPFTTELTAFDPGHFQILLVNNSCARGKLNGRTMQGVLHHADVPEPRTDVQRIINSILLTPGPRDAEDTLPPAERQRFMESDELSEYSRA
ncbi:hypothetical protein [Thalassoroseus pseudoceratinae]|uniref:hypothetical protein n=1 Tax=Thalassoroseus pseudoceratinae TaxID=2713176 RepID=UPI00141DF5DF|nr:hypothetical protein [Thalassoroseus pseudoceratinae]